MRKTVLILIAVLTLGSLNSNAQIDMSIYGGISTPSSDMAKVYYNNQDVWELINKGMDIGWHLGARVRLPIDTGLFFFGGFGWHRFSDVQLEIENIENDTTYQISAKQDIIPIGAGLQYYITRKVINFYVLGALNYNYFTTQGSFIGLPAPNFDLSTATSRMGFTAAAGVEFNLVLFYPFLEFSYSMPNLIGKTDGEPTKSYFNISLGLNL